MSIRSKAGDTVVEVMLALTILSAVIFMAWSLTTRATRQSLAARQRVEMVNQMKEQAEIIKSIYAAQGGNGAALKAALGPPAEVPPVGSPCEGFDFQNPSPAGKFYLAATDTAINPVPGAKEVNGIKEQRVWVQYDEVTPATGTGYIDFYVRACWQTSGGIQQTDLSEFVVRLNL